MAVRLETKKTQSRVKIEERRRKKQYRRFVVVQLSC